MAKRISIINFKGGVGKTTLAFELAAGLARFYNGARVLIIDVDHQSSLSIVCMGADEWQEAVDANETVASVFSSFGGANPMPGHEIIHGNDQLAKVPPDRRLAYGPYVVEYPILCVAGRGCPSS